MSLLKLILTYGEKHFPNKEFNNDNISEKFLHDIHPKQIVYKLDKKPFMFYEVKYQYTTNRGNRRDGIKYFILNTYSPEENMREELDKYINDFNKENSNRQLLNVKFLESRCLGYVTL